MSGPKVILVLIDGLAWSVARECTGYLSGLMAAGKASCYRLRCELPSLSRPLYECILTGVRPVDSGVVHNQVTRLSDQQSIFHLAHAAGLRTAAAAYHWVSELYNRSPWQPIRDRHTHDESLPIQHGVFYFKDHYPDEHLFIDAEWLRRQYDPHFLLIHPMNVDDAGHQAGLDSAEYRNQARYMDMILSEFIPAWISEGYQVVITSDHGMNNDHTHGGVLDCECDVPLWVIGDAFSHVIQAHPLQTELCGLVASLLGIPHSKPVCEELLR